MTSALLDSLKIKNTPKKLESVDVIIPKPGAKEDVVIKTRVVDKTMENNNIDRTLFLKTIGNKIKTQKKLLTPEPEMDESKVKILLDSLLEEIGDDLTSYSLKDVIQKLSAISGVEMKRWKGVIKPMLIQYLEDLSLIHI